MFSEPAARKSLVIYVKTAFGIPKSDFFPNWLRTFVICYEQKEINARLICSEFCKYDSHI